MVSFSNILYLTFLLLTIHYDAHGKWHTNNKTKVLNRRQPLYLYSTAWMISTRRDRSERCHLSARSGGAAATNMTAPRYAPSHADWHQLQADDALAVPDAQPAPAPQRPPEGPAAASSHQCQADDSLQSPTRGQRRRPSGRQRAQQPRTRTSATQMMHRSPRRAASAGVPAPEGPAAASSHQCQADDSLQSPTRGQRRRPSGRQRAQQPQARTSSRQMMHCT